MFCGVTMTFIDEVKKQCPNFPSVSEENLTSLFKKKHNAYQFSMVKEADLATERDLYKHLLSIFSATAETEDLYDLLSRVDPTMVSAEVMDLVDEACCEEINSLKIKITQALSSDQNPMDCLELLEAYSSTPMAFTALLAYLLAYPVSVDTIIQSGLMHRYLITFLPNHAQFIAPYRWLTNCSIDTNKAAATALINQAKETSPGISGIYISFTGEVAPKITQTPGLLPPTDRLPAGTNADWDKLYSFFGPLFLGYVLLSQEH